MKFRIEYMFQRTLNLDINTIICKDASAWKKSFLTLLFFFFFIYLIVLFPNMFERYGLKQNKYKRNGGSGGGISKEKQIKVSCENNLNCVVLELASDFFVPSVSKFWCDTGRSKEQKVTIVLKVGCRKFEGQCKNGQLRHNWCEFLRGTPFGEDLRKLSTPENMSA